MTCLHTWWIGRTVDIKWVAAPRHGNTFLRVQQGVFTYHPFANEYFLDHGRWPCIEEFREADQHADRLNRFPPLVRLTMPSSEADELLSLLYRYDVTRHHMQPTFDNAAKAFAYRKALWPAPTGY